MSLFRSIRGRLLYGILALALLPLILATVVVTYLGYQQASNSLTERAQAQLQAIQTVKRDEVDAYLKSIETNLRVLATDPTLRAALAPLTEGHARSAAAVSATVSEADQREALKRYYGEAFTQQFLTRNPGGKVDMAAIVDVLPANAVAQQYAYIASNPEPLGSKNNLDVATLGDAGYNATHAQIQPYARRIVEQYGFYDIFLIDAASGNVVYTYFKELDFATSLTDGPWAGSGLGDAFIAARDSDDANTVKFIDYRPYLPSYDDQAAFFSLPIIKDGKTVAVLAAQAPIDRINAIASFRSAWEATGLGRTGELLLVGPDNLPRSISRGMIQQKDAFLAQLRALPDGDKFAPLAAARSSDVGYVPNQTAVVASALKGESGVSQYRNRFGREVIGSYAPLTVGERTWAVVAELESSEALAPVQALLRQQTFVALGIGLVLALLAGLIANRVARSINRPISDLSATVGELNRGNMDARVRLTQDDELGELGRALDNLLDDRVATLNQAARENEQLNDSVIEIMQSVSQLAQNDLTVSVPVTPDVTGAVSDAINMLTKETSSALKRVLTTASDVDTAAGQLKQRTLTVLEAANLNEREVQAASAELKTAADALAAVARDAEEAQAKAADALRTSTQGLRIVSDTVNGVQASRDQIRETEKRVKRLAERSQEITGVVQIINQIAERTAVLALNAGMQAAAAGEAGRGFAVVAEEVKRLADSARGATNQIGTLVSGIQADAADTMRTMNDSLAQFVQITRLAERAGEEVQSSMLATDELVSAVQSIAVSSGRQAKVSGALLERAERIEETTHQTQTELDKQTANVAQLSDLAGSLLDTVRVFKLPD
jgi:methyl-accepting chemotaxis protein